MGICIGCIVAKTNILVCVVGTNVPTWVHAYLYARPLLFKETIFPYLIDQATRISLQNQLWNIPKVVIIF